MEWGKDSALALYKVLQSGQFDVQTLLTSISEPYQRISMHGLPVDLLDRQVDAHAVPLRVLILRFVLAKRQPTAATSPEASPTWASPSKNVSLQLV